MSSANLAMTSSTTAAGIGGASVADSPRAGVEAPTLTVAVSVDEAVQTLGQLAPHAAPLAGGTWVMRAGLRGERLQRHYVAVGSVEELRRVEPHSIGAAATHAQMSRLGGALGEAARASAFPAVRQVATLAGNLCADPFPAADLLPALLALEARLEVRSPAGTDEIGVAEFIATRSARPPAELIVRALLPADGSVSAFERLTVRGGGEYAIASIAVAAQLDGDVVRSARVAVGGVETVARRCEKAERLLVGCRLHARLGDEVGRAAAEELDPREGADAPGWYRLAVLPVLARRAVARLGVQAAG